MRNTGQLASVGRGVWVGNYQSCRKTGDQFDRVLHIWHPDQPGHCSMAEKDAVSGSDDFVLQYKEHSPLPAEDLLQELHSWLMVSGSLLVHCAAGMGRSTLFAVFALMLRGRSLGEAMGDVATATWTGYAHRLVPRYNPVRLEELAEFYEKHRGV